MSPRRGYVSLYTATKWHRKQPCAAFGSVWKRSFSRVQFQVQHGTYSSDRLSSPTAYAQQTLLSGVTPQMTADHYRSPNPNHNPSPNTSNPNSNHLRSSAVFRQTCAYSVSRRRIAVGCWTMTWTAINRSRVRIPASPLSSATLCKLLTHTWVGETKSTSRTSHVPPSPSSIIWYQPMGGDALRLRR